MNGKKYTPAQITQKLRQAVIEISNGASIQQTSSHLPRQLPAGADRSRRWASGRGLVTRPRAIPTSETARS